MECTRYDEFDACADALLAWEIEATQLDHGPFEGELIQVRSPAALVSEVTFGRALHQKGEPPRGMRTLGVPADPAQRIFFQRKWNRGNQLMIFPRGGELDSVSLAGFHVFSISFEEDRMSEICHALSGTDYPGLLSGREVANSTSGGMHSLRHAIRRLMISSGRHEDGDAQAAFVPRDDDLALLEAIAEVLTLDEDSLPPEPFRVRERAVRRSLDLIEESNGEPISVVDLCRATGVSRRTLEYAFKERFRLSPKAYMLTWRLGKVRADLRQNHAGQSITWIANHWGFYHLSRFAASYKRLFGELPSETIHTG